MGTRARAPGRLPSDGQRGRVHRLVPRRARLGRRRDRQPGRVVALQLRDPRRARAVYGARGGGAPLERRRARGVAAELGDRRPRRGPRDREGPGRLPRGARVPGGADMTTRVDRLRESLEEPLLVTNGVNVRYLVGFASSNAALLVEPDRVRLFSDFRYAEAGRAVEGVEFVETKRSLVVALAELLEGRIGFEADAVNYTGWETLAGGGLDLVPRRGQVEALRAVKDDGELDAIRRAGKITSEAYERFAEESFIGRTER